MSEPTIDEIIDNNLIAGVYLKETQNDNKVFYEATIVCETIDEPCARNGLTKVFLNKAAAVAWLEQRHRIRSWYDFARPQLPTAPAVPVAPAPWRVKVI